MAKDEINANITVIPEKRSGDYTGLAQIIVDTGDKVIVAPMTHRNLTNLLKEVYVVMKKLETLDVADRATK